MKQLKEEYGIGAVLDLNDVKSEAKAAEKVGLKYIGKKTPFIPTVAILESLSKTIDREIKTGNKVFVHCHKGVYRGPTAAVAYLVYKGLTVEEAVKQVRDRRPIALPGMEDSKRLMPVLKQYESKVHSKKSPKND